MTLTELIFKHSTNLLALAKIRGAVEVAADAWGISIGTINPDASIPLYIPDDLIDTADYNFYATRITADALYLLKSHNPELFKIDCNA